MLFGFPTPNPVRRRCIHSRVNFELPSSNTIFLSSWRVDTLNRYHLSNAWCTRPTNQAKKKYCGSINAGIQRDDFHLQRLQIFLFHLYPLHIYRFRLPDLGPNIIAPVSRSRTRAPAPYFSNFGSLPCTNPQQNKDVISWASWSISMTIGSNTYWDATATTPMREVEPWNESIQDANVKGQSSNMQGHMRKCTISSRFSIPHHIIWICPEYTRSCRTICMSVKCAGRQVGFKLT